MGLPRQNMQKKHLTDMNSLEVPIYVLKLAWSWLGRMAQDDPREPWDARGNDRGCMYWPSAPDSGYSSASSDDVACDSDDGDSFYFTPPEIEDPNEVRISP